MDSTEVSPTLELRGTSASYPSLEHLRVLGVRNHPGLTACAVGESAAGYSPTSAHTGPGPVAPKLNELEPLLTTLALVTGLLTDLERVTLLWPAFASLSSFAQATKAAPFCLAVSALVCPVVS